MGGPAVLSIPQGVGARICARELGKSLQWDERGEPVLSFHGTGMQAADGIVKDGFLMPGSKGIGTVNGSVYGRGLYQSPDMAFAGRYCRGAILVCLTLLGNAVVITNQGAVQGKGCLSGFDSHVSAP